MNKNGDLYKKSLICIGLIAIVAFTMVNIQFASAGTNANITYKTHEYGIEPSNYTEILYCDGCHYDDPDVSITVTIDSETQSDITYYVTGSTETFEGIEGWGVFETSLENKVAGGQFSGYFTLPKDGKTYRVFWVDNGTTDPPDPEYPGGSAYTDVTTTASPPSTPVITGESSGKTGKTYTFTINSVDPDGDGIFYYIKWGDGDTEDWFGPFDSGEDATKSHSWSSKGTYTIQAKARDTSGYESDWGEFTIEIEKSRTRNIQFFRLLQDHYRFFQRLFSLLYT